MIHYKRMVLWVCLFGGLAILTSWAIKYSYDNSWVATDHRNPDARLQAGFPETPQEPKEAPEAKETVIPPYKNIVPTAPKY